MEYNELKEAYEKLLRQVQFLNEPAATKASSVGGVYFREIVLSLNKALNADYTFIGALSDDFTSIKTLSNCYRGEVIGNFSYELLNTPCEHVVGLKPCSYKENVTKLFPKDEMLIDMGVEGYIGIPLFDSKATPNGILVSLFKSPIQNTESLESISGIFAVRAGAELEHKRTYTEMYERQKVLEAKVGEITQANVEITNNEEMFKLLYEHLGTANSFFNIEGVLLFQNEYSSSLLSKSKDNVIGKDLTDLFGEEQGSIIKKRLREVIIKGEPLVYETLFNLPVGKKWFRSIYNPVVNNENKVIGIQLTSTDINREKEAELKFKDNEKKYSHVVENTSDLITIVNAKGEFVFVNNASYNILGYSPEECVGRQAFDFVHPDDIEKTKKSFDEWKVKGGCRFSFENRQIHKDGSSRIMQWNIIIHRKRSGEIVEITSIARDISGFKVMENELKKALEKAEESDKLKSAFLSNVSHEIRTPMNGVLGFADLLAEPDVKDEKRTYYADVIRSSSQQLMQVINDIIDISKIESEEFVLSNINLNIPGLINELIEQAKIMLFQKKKSQIKLKSFIDDRVQTIYNDKVRLSQILLNLLSNAVKFTEQGEIEVGVKIPDDQNIVFYVRDTGQGIVKEKQKIIFERFRKADDLNSFNEGTGLGLAISKMITEKLGGDLKLFSIPGEGALFELSLPYVKKDNEIRNPSIASKQLKSEILVVEDEEINFLYIKEILSLYHLNITRAKNGKEAVDLFKAKIPGLVLMDLKMPVMDGFESFEEIRKINSDVPIVAITAYAYSSDQKKVIDSGFSGYLAKPVSKNQLINTVKKFVSFE